MASHSNAMKSGLSLSDISAPENYHKIVEFGVKPNVMITLRCSIHKSRWLINY